MTTQTPGPVDKVIRGGTVVTTEETFQGSIAIDDEKIVAVGSESALPPANETIDATNKIVLPGVVDPHVHTCDSSSIDTYETVTKAAALGGVTTFINFAWEGWEGNGSYHSPDTSLLDGIEYCIEASDEAVVDYSVHGTLATERMETLELIESAVDMGVTSFKMFTAYEFGLSNGYIEQVLEELATLDAVGLVHTEDNDVCNRRTERLKNEEKGESVYYPMSRPDYAEAMAAEDVVRMAKESGAKYYGVHTTSRKSAEVIDAFRADGSQVRAETCTHYTVYDDSIYDRLGNLPMIAPPIRNKEDREAMFDYIRNGTFDVVSTDHCAYTAESKQTENWWESSFGVNSIQTSFEVFHDVAINEQGLSYPTLVRLMCANPAQTFGLSEKGTLQPGTDADIVVFDPNATRVIDPVNNASKADFSIYEGREVTGCIEKTLVRGELVADNGEIVAGPGFGTFVERDRPDWHN